MPKEKKSDHAFHSSYLNHVDGFHGDERAASGKPKTCANDYSEQRKHRLCFLGIKILGSLSSGASRMICRLVQNHVIKGTWVLLEN